MTINCVILPTLQGYGPECRGDPLARGVTDEEQKLILKVHNRWRSNIATGKEKRGQPGPQPGASNMKFMVSFLLHVTVTMFLFRCGTRSWRRLHRDTLTSAILTMTAATAGEHPGTHNSKHKSCIFRHFNVTLSSVRFAVGQNLYIYRMMNRAPNNDWTRAITDWYDEVTLYSNEDVDRWKYHSETGHYTQVKRTFCISNMQVICDPNNINH